MFFSRQGRFQTDNVRLDWELPAAAFDQADQKDRGWTPKIENFVHGGPDGSPGLDYIVYQDDVPIIHFEWNVGGFHLRVHTDSGEIVTVETDIEQSQRFCNGQFTV